jgi:phosphoglycerate dehydrogenase-like enzyme
MSRLAILDDYQHAARRVVDWDLLGPDVEVVTFHERLVGDILVEAVRDFEMIYVMRERSTITRPMLEQLTNLKIIVTNGMANAAIDLVAAADLGILVSGTPSGLYSTTEITWALILAVAKGIPRADASVRAGTWQHDLPGDLAGKTLGLVGLGRLGAAMVPIAKAFSMQIIAWSQNLTAERTDKFEVSLVTKAELLRESDYISIHLRLSDRTKNLIGTDELALMKSTASIINSSRGPIIDEAALICALRERRIAGAGLDVYDEEPVAKDHPFNSLDNIVLTPHIGYASEENLREYLSEGFMNVAAYLAGAPQRLIVPGKDTH